MEGLIKGLINVALDGIEGGRGDQNERDEERSRSSWAEVGQPIIIDYPLILDHWI